MQYIFGEWAFYGREFYVGPGVLVPRADTETLVDVCLKYLENTENPAVLDLCAGSGCIGITLALEKAGAGRSHWWKNSPRLRAMPKGI